MVVTSQPYNQSMTPVTRQTPVPPPPMMQPASHSPRPIPQHVPSHVHTPVAPPSPAPTPKQEQEQVVPPQEATSPLQVPSRRQSAAVNPLTFQPEHKMPFYPELPWYSAPGGSNTFPRRAAGRRRRLQNMDNIESVALPQRGVVEEEAAPEVAAEEPTPSETSTIPAPSEPETPATSQAPSESEFTQVSTPTTPAQAAPPKATPPQSHSQHARRDTRTAIAVPNIPGIAKPKTSPAISDKQEVPAPQLEKSVAATEETKPEKFEEEQAATEEEAAATTPPAKPVPKSWADLVRRNVPASTTSGTTNVGAITTGAQLPKSASLADALKQYSVQTDFRLSFIEPRGLVNTGNMCYMNSVCLLKHTMKLRNALTIDRFCKF